MSMSKGAHQTNKESTVHAARSAAIELSVDLQYILENQVAIMTALLAMKPNVKVEADLYYHIAKTQAYKGMNK